MSTRRDFIKTIIVAGGVVFTDWQDLAAAAAKKPGGPIVETLRYKAAHEFLRERKRSASFSKPHGHYDCVIIGSGVSGLAAAWRLKKEGMSYIILDGEPVAGGAARSGEWHGHRYSMGSGYFVTYDTLYKEIYDDIGLHLLKTGEDALWYGPDEMYVNWWTDDGIAMLPIPQGERDAFKKFRDDLIKFDGLPDYPLSKADPKKIAQYDPMSAAQYLEQYNSPSLSKWMNKYNMSSCGATNIDTNAYCFLNFYSSEFGDSFNLPRYSFPGGIVGTVEKLRGHIGAGNIHTGSLVLEVHNDGGGVNVGYLDAHDEPHLLRGKTAILAGQKRICRNLVPEMPKEQKDLCTQVRYAPYITVNLLCRQPLLPKRAFDVWFGRDDLLFTDIVDGDMVQDLHRGHLDRKLGGFTYCVYCPQPEPDRKKLEDPAYLAEFAQRLADNIELHVPGSREAILEMHVFAFGHTMVIPAPGTHTLFHPTVSQPVGNIFFGNTDNDVSPSVESGIINGHDAAEQAIAAMKKG